MGSKVRTSQHRSWLQDYYAQLKGARVQGVELEQYEGKLYPVLEMVLEDSTVVTVEVSRDEEGNGPGFLHGLPRPR